MKKKRARRRPYYRRYEPTEGLEINQFIENRRISLCRTAISLFDYDNVTLEEHGPYRTVSIMRKVSKVNNFRSSFLNGYAVKIHGH